MGIRLGIIRETMSIFTVGLIDFPCDQGPNGGGYLSNSETGESRPVVWTVR